MARLKNGESVGPRPAATKRAKTRKAAVSRGLRRSGEAYPTFAFAVRKKTLLNHEAVAKFRASWTRLGYDAAKAVEATHKVFRAMPNDWEWPSQPKLDSVDSRPNCTRATDSNNKVFQGFEVAEVCTKRGKLVIIERSYGPSRGSLIAVPVKSVHFRPDPITMTRHKRRPASQK